MEDMIAPVKRARALQSQQILRVGHHGDNPGIALSVDADFARRLRRQVLADAAFANGVFGLNQRIGKLAHFGHGLTQDVKRQPLGRFRPMPGSF